MSLLTTGIVIQLLCEEKFETGHVSVITLVEALRGKEYGRLSTSELEARISS